MHVMIMPTIESICEDYGLDYYDDSNTRELLEQQGLEAYQIEVNDGESFEIPQGLIGRIDQGEQNYYNILPGRKGLFFCFLFISAWNILYFT